MENNCKHLWLNKDSQRMGWSGQYGYFTCARCLAICRFEQAHKKAPMEIIDIIESETNDEVEE